MTVLLLVCSERREKRRTEKWAHVRSTKERRISAGCTIKVSQRSCHQVTDDTLMQSRYKVRVTPCRGIHDYTCLNSYLFREHSTGSYADDCRLLNLETLTPNENCLTLWFICLLIKLEKPLIRELAT